MLAEQSITRMDTLHGKNIIHRDLKPANFMRFGVTWKIGKFGNWRIGEANFASDSGELRNLEC